MALKKIQPELIIKAVQINDDEVISFENPLQPRVISLAQAKLLNLADVSIGRSTFQKAGSDLNLKIFGQKPIAY